MNSTRFAQFPGCRFSRRILVSVVLAGAMVAAVGHAEPSAEPVPTADERIRVLEEQVATLAAELSENRISEAVPADSEFDPVWGVGSSASKVYSQDGGLSIGGYGEVRFQHNSTDDDIFDALRAVLYVGYKFSDSWVLNSEIEFEHGGGSDVFVEFLNLDYLHSDALNFRVGLILIPMGFVNQLHEPTFYYGASRPEVEKTIIPSTWRENGAGFFGRFGDRVTYQAYAVSSFEGSNFNASGFRPGRQKGMKAITNDWSFVVRTDLAAMSGLNVGASVYYGNQGQDQSVGTTQVGNLSTAISELHAEYQRYGFTVRGLFSQAFVDNPDALNFGIDEVIAGGGDAADAAMKGGFLAESLLGGYVEFAYDIMPRLLPETEQSFEPFFRYERLNTQSRMQSATFARTLKYDRHLYTVGLQYQPIPQVVFKLDYRWITQQSNGASLDKQVEFGAGYVF